MANQFFVQPAQFGQGLQQLAGGVERFKAGQAQEQQQMQEQERRQLLQQKMQAVMNPETGQVDPKALTDLILTDPDIGGAVRNQLGLVDEQQKTQALNKATSLKQILKTASPEQAMQIFQQEGYADDPVFAGLADNLQAGDIEGAMNELQYGVAAVGGQPALDAFMGLGGQGEDASTRHFNYLLNLAQNGTPEQQRAARIELGTAPRAGISAAERIAQDPTVTQQVAQSGAVIEGAKAGAREEAQLEQQLEMKPRIQKAIKEAEQAAASRGESLSELNRAEAALPGIREVVNKLTTLADVATYTEGGKAFDQIVKQLGFGSTEGATARAQMLSIVDNQVLPLLRDTFGAAFTAAEGERLTKTLMDPDASPETKKAQLNAFIEQKMRDIETKRRVAGEAAEPAADLSIEDLINQYGG